MVSYSRLFILKRFSRPPGLMRDASSSVSLFYRFPHCASGGICHEKQGNQKACPAAVLNEIELDGFLIPSNSMLIDLNVPYGSANVWVRKTAI